MERLTQEGHIDWSNGMSSFILDWSCSKLAAIRQDQMVALDTAADTAVLYGDIAYTFNIIAITFRWGGITIWLIRSWRWSRF